MHLDYDKRTKKLRKVETNETLHVKRSNHKENNAIQIIKMAINLHRDNILSVRYDFFMRLHKH